MEYLLDSDFKTHTVFDKKSPTKNVDLLFSSMNYMQIVDFLSAMHRLSASGTFCLRSIDLPKQIITYIRNSCRNQISDYRFCIEKLPRNPENPMAPRYLFFCKNITCTLVETIESNINDYYHIGEYYINDFFK